MPKFNRAAIDALLKARRLDDRRSILPSDAGQLVAASEIIEAQIRVLRESTYHAAICSKAPGGDWVCMCGLAATIAVLDTALGQVEEAIRCAVEREGENDAETTDETTEN